MKEHRIAPEVKEQTINRIKNDGISVAEAAKDHGISDQTVYGWIAKKVEGQPRKHYGKNSTKKVSELELEISLQKVLLRPY